MAGPLNFTGQNIEDSYQRVLQTDGTIITDGTGSFVNLQFSGSFSGSYVGDGSGLTGITVDDTGLTTIVQDLQTITNSQQTTLSNHETRITGVEGLYVPLNIAVASNTANITTAQDDISATQTDIAALQISASAQTASIAAIQLSLPNYVLIEDLPTSQVGLANTASFVTSSNVVGPFGPNSIATASYVPLQQGAGITVNGMQITANLRKVNGNDPDSITGNVAISLAAVETGTSASLAAYPTGGLAEGTVWIVSSDTADRNGDAYIYNSGSVGQWLSIAPLDQTSADARYARTGLSVVQQLTSSFAATASFVTSASFAATASLRIFDEGSLRTATPTTINFVGDGVTTTNSGTDVTVTVSGGGGGGFPYYGNAEMSGSLRVTGSFREAGVYELGPWLPYTGINIVPVPTVINGLKFSWVTTSDPNPVPANTSDTIYLRYVAGSSNNPSIFAFVSAFNASKSLAPYSDYIGHLEIVSSSFSSAGEAGGAGVFFRSTTNNYLGRTNDWFTKANNGVGSPTASLRAITPIDIRNDVRLSGSLIISGGFQSPPFVIIGNPQITGSLEARDGVNNVRFRYRFAGAGENVAIAGETTVLNSVTTGFGNFAIGSGSLQAITTGVSNIGIGSASLWRATSAQNNVAVGLGAMYNCINGADNIALGTNALRFDTDPRSTVVIGPRAVQNATGTVASSVIIGADAMSGAGAGSAISSSLIGAEVAMSGSPEDVVAIGSRVFRQTPFPYYSVAIGSEAGETVGLYNRTAQRGLNVMIGRRAMQFADHASNCVAIGGSALRYLNTGGANVAIGLSAMGDIINHLTFTGAIATSSFGGSPISASVNLTSAISGLSYVHLKNSFYVSISFNDPTDALRPYTVVSSSVLTSTTLGTNTSFTMSFTDGATPLNAGISWSFIDPADYGVSNYNTAVGANAMQYYAGGSTVGMTGRGDGYNLALGYQALQGYARTDATVPAQFKTGSSGQLNTAVGAQTQVYFYRGNENVALGAQAMQGRAASPFIGNFNLAIGSNTMRFAAGGISNTGIGYAAGYYYGTGSSYNIAVGNNAQQNVTSGSDNIAIGRFAHVGGSTGLNSAPGTSGSNNITIGYRALTSIIGGSNNTVIGYNAGARLLQNSSHNIVLGSEGPTGNQTNVSGGLWIGAIDETIVAPTAAAGLPSWASNRAPLIGGSQLQKYVFIYNKLGIGKATASYTVDAISTTPTDTVMSFDGGTQANARLLVAADTSTAAATGHTGKTAGVYFLDRNNGLIENNINSNSAYIYLARSVDTTYTVAPSASRNDLVYTNLHNGKGHYFVTRAGATNRIVMIVTGSGLVLRTGSLSIQTGSLTMSGSLLMTGSATILSGSLTISSGSLIVTGSTNLLGPLTVTGSTNLSGSIRVSTGSVIINNGPLIVSGTSFFSGSLIPNVPTTSFTSSFTLGTPTAAWKKLYVGEGSIEFVNGSGVEVATISVQPDGAVKVPSLYTEGSITVNTIVSQSTTYIVEQYHATGSNIFGSSSLDTHQFTGSMFVSGAMYVSDVQPSFGYNIITFDTGSGRLYYTSSLSLVGPQGAIGPAGPSGSQGPTGETGPQGAQGEVGPAGPSGSEGSQGPQGDQGLPGPIGPTGPQGLQGEQGSQGLQGDPGLGFTPLDVNLVAVIYDTQITGSLSVSGGITGSLLGSSSYALTASYIDPVYISASAASYGFGTGGGGSTDISALNTFTGSIQTQVNSLTSATSSFVLTSSTSSMTVLSSSFANTASFINRLVQNVTITGSLFVSNSIDSNNKYLIDNNGIASVRWNNYRLYNSDNNLVVHWGTGDLYSGSFVSSSVSWTNRLLRDSVGITKVDWENNYLTDPTAIISMDWNNRTLYDGSGVESIGWNARSLYTPGAANAFTYDNDYLSNSSIYHKENYRNDVESEALSDTLLEHSGQAVRFGGQIHISCVAGGLVYLDSGPVWRAVDQTTDVSTRMLGIYLDSETVLLEGDVVLDSIQSPDYGSTVYIQNTTTSGDMSTTIPTAGYVRVVGHCYHNNTSTTANWILKFRPSNDWYEI